MTVLLVVAVPLVLALFAMQMERLEAVVLHDGTMAPTEVPDPEDSEDSTE